MKVKLLFLGSFICILLNPGYAQISGPATAIAGVPVTFSGPAGHRSYSWSDGASGPLQIQKPAAGSITRTSIATIAGAQAVNVQYDRGKWYAFTIGWNTLSLDRVNLGTNPTQPSTSIDKIAPYTTAERGMGITFHHDSSTGKWHGFMATQSTPLIIKRFDFDSLAATPTETAITLPAQLSTLSANPYEIIVIKENSEYMLFLSNYWGPPVRIDLGASITNNTPSFGTLLTAPGVSNTTGMAFHKQDGEWNMLLVGVNNKLMRYTFANGIKDAAPVVSEVGTNLLNGNDKYRIRLVSGNCGKQLLAFVNGPANRLYMIDFEGDITRTPSSAMVSVMASDYPSQLNQGLYPYVYNNELHMMTGVFGSNAILDMKISDLPSRTQHVYNNPVQTMTFANAGTYELQLAVDMDGDVPANAYCHTVVVSASSAALAQPGLFTSAPALGCQGQNNVTYTVPAVNGAVAYHWNYTGSNVNYTASTSQPTNSLNFLANATGGQLRVWGVSTNNDSSILPRDTAITVQQTASQPGNFTASAGTVCQGASGLAFTVPNVPGVTYTWSYSGNGATINGTGNSITADFNASATSGSLGVTATNGCGTSAARNITVTVNPLPNVSITPASASICAGESITLMATGAAVYDWSNGGGNNASATFTPSAATTYSVTGTTSGCSSTATRQVLYYNLPATQITVTGNITQVCTGDTVELTASGTGYTYQWKDATGTVSTGSSFGAYRTGDYKVIATDVVSNCSDSTPAVGIMVHPLPVISLDQQDTSLCAGGIVRLEVSTADTGLTYTWKRDNMVMSLATAYFIEISDGGVYKAIAGRASVAACEDSTNEVMVIIHPLPVVGFTWDGEWLRATPGHASYQWQRANQGLPGATDSLFRPDVSDNYSVRVTDSNGCEATSLTRHISNVGVSTVSPDMLRIYPNPVTGGVLHIESAEEIRVVLRTIDGRVLLSAPNLKYINMDEYAGGVYLLQIMNAKGMPLHYERILNKSIHIN